MSFECGGRTYAVGPKGSVVAGDHARSRWELRVCSRASDEAVGNDADRWNSGSVMQTIGSTWSVPEPQFLARGSRSPTSPGKEGAPVKPWIGGVLFMRGRSPVQFGCEVAQTHSDRWVDPEEVTDRDGRALCYDRGTRDVQARAEGILGTFVRWLRTSSRRTCERLLSSWRHVRVSISFLEVRVGSKS